MAADYCAFFPYFRPGGHFSVDTRLPADFIAENRTEITRRSRFHERNLPRFPFFE
jgi:hypothetical protein